MEELIPWDRLEKRIRPYYPKAGRQPYALAAMLRIHCLQSFYNVSDAGMEDMLYEIESVRRFAGLHLGGPLPDEAAILNFRHLLEKHVLRAELLAQIDECLTAQGVQLQKGAITAAGILDAPSPKKGDR